MPENDESPRLTALCRGVQRCEGRRERFHLSISMNDAQSENNEVVEQNDESFGSGIHEWVFGLGQNNP